MKEPKRTSRVRTRRRPDLRWTVKECRDLIKILNAKDFTSAKEQVAFTIALKAFPKAFPNLGRGKENAVNIRLSKFIIIDTSDVREYHFDTTIEIIQEYNDCIFHNPYNIRIYSANYK